MHYTVGYACIPRHDLIKVNIADHNYYYPIIHVMEGRGCSGWDIAMGYCDIMILTIGPDCSQCQAVTQNDIKWEELWVVERCG